MKRNFLLSAGFAVTAMLLVSQTLFTNIVQPPTGYTGAFLSGSGNEPTCASAGCHDGNAQLNSSLISLTSVGSPSLTGGYLADTIYNLAVNAGSASAYGFSLTAVTATGSPIGTFTLTSPSNTSLVTDSASNNKQYVGHKNANTTNAWTFKWNSPATNAEAAYFFLAVNQANNNGESTGDQIHLKAYSATSTGFAPYTVGTGVQNIDGLQNGEVSLFPNPVVEDVNISFTLAGTQPVTAAIFNLNGQLVKPLMDETLTWGTHDRTFAVGSDLSTGIYLVKFTVGDAQYFKKIVVE